MKKLHFFLMLITTSFIFSACFTASINQDPHPCELVQNCIYDSAAGSSECKEGYTWENPEDANNYNCVLIELDNCEPTTCTALGFNCGEIPDGCDATLNCGDCPQGQTCGAGGPNICGEGSCTPTTCAAQGANCGSISDGCGGILNCGTCPEGQTCSGGGVDNVCGSPTTEPPSNLDNAHLLQEKFNMGCAIMQNNSIACWGGNYNGRAITQMQSGAYLGLSGHCNLDSLGNIQCLRFSSNTSEMHNISGGPYKQMAAVWGSFVVAIDQNGTVHVFDTGTGENHADITAPAGSDFISVSLGSFVGCTLNESGQIGCWSFYDTYVDTYGLLSGVPTTGTFRQVVVGERHICALSIEGAVSCWGINDGSSWDDDGQVTDAPTSGTYTALAASDMATCALSSNGQVNCWGESYGNDNRIVATDSTFQTLTMDDSNVNYPDVCMRHTNGTISCGKSRTPELIQNTFIDFDISRSWLCGITTEGQAICSDYEHNAHKDLPWNEIDANAPYSKIAIWTPDTGNSNKKTNLCTVDTNHRLRCWNAGGAHGTAYVVPAVDDLTTTQFTDVGLGQMFGCGLDLDNKIVCFGGGSNGQRSAPTDSQYTSLTVGTCKSCAIDANDKMVCWGYGGSGIPSDESYKVVSTSNSGVCSGPFTWAIDINDELAIWGLPNPPTTSGLYKDVATGGNDACAITTGGAIECWGMTEDPPTGTNFNSVYGNQTHYNSTQACALTTSGQLACWGSLFIPIME